MVASSYSAVRASLRTRLDQSPRGDRGWFFITRVHLSATRLQESCAYLYAVAGRAPHVLASEDYAALARINGVTAPNPGITLRRHYLLAMQSPLGFIERTDGNRWSRIALSDLGVELALAHDASTVVEKALRQIVFCRTPWYTHTRVRQYREFQLHPYLVAHAVMRECDGWIDRDEYDLFVSRLRREGGIKRVSAQISAFRQFSDAERASLLTEVRARIPGAKEYQNWRDSALHTFSLFGLSASMLRSRDRLVLTTRVVRDVQPAPPARRPTARRGPATLLLPDPPPSAELEAPPAVPEVNPGTDGELLIGKLLVAGGWRVVYYSARRGFGFDLWARRGDHVMLVEVKSSIGAISSLTLTDLEYQAASRHGANYVLAVVEHVNTERPSVAFIPDPVGTLSIRARNVREYHVARSAWTAAVKPLEID